MVFVNKGVELTRDLLAGDSITSPTHMAFGEDNTKPTKGDTTMTTELTRKSLTVTKIGDDEVQFESTLTTTDQNGKTIKEVGLFNDSGGGSMFTHETMADIEKNNQIEVQAIITVRLVN